MNEKVYIPAVASATVAIIAGLVLLEALRGVYYFGSLANAIRKNN